MTPKSPFEINWPLKEEAEIDMLIQTAEDIMLVFAQKAYDPNFVSYKVLNIYPFFRLADFKTSNLRNHLSFKCREGRDKSYKGASIKAYLLLQGLSCD